MKNKILAALSSDHETSAAQLKVLTCAKNHQVIQRQITRLVVSRQIIAIGGRRYKTYKLPVAPISVPWHVPTELLALFNMLPLVKKPRRGRIYKYA